MIDVYSPIHIGDTLVAPPLACQLVIVGHVKVLHRLVFMTFTSWLIERKENDIKLQLHTKIAIICPKYINDHVTV